VLPFTAGIIPGILDIDLLDEVVAVHSDDAMKMTHALWMMGVPTGVSAGAIVEAAVQVCSRTQSENKNVVCIIPSFGERYFTHPMFADIKAEAENMKKQPLPEPFDNTLYGFATPRG
jgi:cysteine synthase A